MALLRLIIILIIVYMIYRLLVRYIIPFLFKAYIRKSKEKFFEQNPNYKKAPQKKEGEVSVDYVPEKKNPTGGSDVGDYVDYEEVN